VVSLEGAASRQGDYPQLERLRRLIDDVALDIAPCGDLSENEYATLSSRRGSELEFPFGYVSSRFTLLRTSFWAECTVALAAACSVCCLV
jgi:hypothetical protein